MGIIPKFYLELTKNKVIFLKKMGEFYSIYKIKYVNTKQDKLVMKRTKKTFNLKETNLLNKYGKRIFYKDYDTGNTILFNIGTIPKLDSDELDAFLGKGFITGFIRMMKGNMFDITSIVLGALIGFFAGGFIVMIVSGSM